MDLHHVPWARLQSISMHEIDLCEPLPSTPFFLRLLAGSLVVTLTFPQTAHGPHFSGEYATHCGRTVAKLVQHERDGTQIWPQIHGVVIQVGSEGQKEEASLLLGQIVDSALRRSDRGPPRPEHVRKGEALIRYEVVPCLAGPDKSLEAEEEDVKSD